MEDSPGFWKPTLLKYINLLRHAPNELFACSGRTQLKSLVSREVLCGIKEQDSPKATSKPTVEVQHQHIEPERIREIVPERGGYDNSGGCVRRH